MTHVSIIIVHYNTPEETDECVLSLQKIKHPGFEYSVVILDNGSRRPYKLPKNLDQKRFEIIRSESNLGFTGGNNLGIYQAIEKHNSEFVLLLNSDTTVDQRFLQEMLKTMNRDQHIGMISPKIYFYPGNEFHPDYNRSEKGRVLWFAGGSVDWRHLAAFHRGVDEVDRGHLDTATTFDFATGCCMLIRREVLEKIGVFDKHLFLYYEDVDLSLRTQEAGYTLAYAPRAIIWHKNAGSSGGSGSSTHDYYQTRNRLYFGYKHGNWVVKLLAFRIALQAILHGSKYARLGVLHAVTGQFGKQQIV